MKIAITGGIGSGKSAVAEVARRKGYCVASCDETYAKLCRSEDFLKDLRKLFPDAVKEDPPRLDRKILANTVFSSDEKRAALNAFAHPRKDLFSCQTAALHHAVDSIFLLPDHHNHFVK